MAETVLIVGGGVIGLSIARELHKKGAGRITIIDKGTCGEESSWAAGGMLGPQAEAEEFGHFYEMCVRSRDLYPAFAADLLDETGIDVELDRGGTLYLALTAEDERELNKRFDLQIKAGLTVERLSAEEARRAEPFVSPDVRGALLFRGDWQVENRRLLLALRRYAELNGIDIIEGTAAEGLLIDKGGVAGAVTTAGEFTAGMTILATGAWTQFIKIGSAVPPLNVVPVRGQMIMFQTAKRLFRHVIYSRRGYLVPRTDGRILAGSTSENVGFEKAVTDAAVAGLRQMAFEIAPSLSGLPLADSWSGLRPYAADALPILGGISGIGGLIVATAHYRNGILLAPLTGSIIADAALGNGSDPALTTFGPDRFRFGSN